MVGHPLFCIPAVEALHGEGGGWVVRYWVSLICARSATFTGVEGGLGLGHFFLCLFLAFRR
jgi:hypothetical protein